MSSDLQKNIWRTGYPLSGYSNALIAFLSHAAEME